MHRIYSVIIILFIHSVAMAQAPVQTIRGRVADRDSHKPVPGASVVTVGTDKKISALSDSSGMFVLHNVAAGRIKIQCTYIGYSAYTTDDIIVNAAKGQEISIEMEEERKMQAGVTVRGVRNQKAPVNKFALVSGRSFSPEETQRFAASANDPSRMELGSITFTWQGGQQ